MILLTKTLVGGMPTYPSEKYAESSVGMMTFPTEWDLLKKKSKAPSRNYL
jgi:hypothetical protein